MHEYILYTRMFENATWILTDQNKIATEYNSQQMAVQVVSAYVSYYNKHYSQPPYCEPKIDERDVSVRYLQHRLCVIYRHKISMVESVSYNQIFPDYEIECYDYHYQCPDCKYLLDVIKRKDEDPPDYVFCSRCLIAVSLKS